MPKPRKQAFDVGAPSADIRADAAPVPADLLDRPLGAARAQIHETYIVAQTRDGLVVVDQHAAHERIVYERMKAAIERAGVARQILLIPEIVEMDDHLVERLVARAEELARFGLVIESFGPGAVAVRETPSMLGETDARALLRDLAEHIEEWDETLPLERRLLHVSATMACHGSVRAGRRLKPRRNERTAARDGSDAEFRPVQSRPADLCGAQARGYREAVWATMTLKPKKYTHYHKDGTVWAKGQKTGDVMTGYWQWFRKDGVIMRSGSFTAKGEQTGTWTTYDRTGKVYKVTTMKLKGVTRAVKKTAAKKKKRRAT